MKKRAPRHLSAAAKRWWRSIASEWELESHHEKLLTLAAEALDRGEQARQLIAEHGPTYDDRFGQPKARPEVAMERDSRLGFARLVRELGLDHVDPAAARPPRIAGQA